MPGRARRRPIEVVKNLEAELIWSFGGRFLNACPSQVILTDEPFTVSSAQPGVDAAMPVSRQDQVASTQFLADFGQIAVMPQRRRLHEGG
jgi:hypothetical protein